MVAKRKVLFFIDSLSCGGAEKSLISLLPLLDYSKIDVDLMMVKRGGVFEQFVPVQVNIVDFPKQIGIWYKICNLSFRLMHWLLPFLHGAEVRWQMMSSAYKGLEKTYDVAIAYQQGFPTYYLVEKINACKKYAWINADIIKAGYRISFNSFYYRKLDMVIPVSEVLSEMLKTSGLVDKLKLFPIYDILNAELIRKMSQQQVDFSPVPNKFVITTVGRMVAAKGYDLAVEAARILKDKGLQFEWLFVGGGKMKPEIKRMISVHGLEEYIHLLGMKPNPYPYMKMADIYVQTSRFEGFGLTLNEARILYKPVVSTNFSVVYNQIKDGENGLICEMTPESIADRILQLTSDKEQRKRLVEATKLEINTTAQSEPAKVMNLILS